MLLDVEVLADEESGTEQSLYFKIYVF